MSKESKIYRAGTTFDEMIDYAKNMKNIDEEEPNDILDSLLETTLKEKEKQDKILRIIKKIFCITSDDFFEETIGFKKAALTQEEFDLLKEYFK